MKMEEVKIEKLSDYVDVVCEMETKQERNGADKNEILLYRGQSDKAYKLIPSLGRSRMFACDISIFDEERNLIEMAKYRLPDVFRKDLEPLELLSLLQHHGIPTRLLDISENAFVALYFACADEKNKNKDGAVFTFQDNEVDVTNYPIIQAIADSYRFLNASFSGLDDFYKCILAQPYFLEQKEALRSSSRTDQGRANWIESCCKKPLFVYAPARHLRQQMQRGRYILFPNKISQDEKTGRLYFEKVIEPISEEDESIYRKIIIPTKHKDRFIRELRQFGISRESLFADSIDVVCSEIVAGCQRRISRQ